MVDALGLFRQFIEQVLDVVKRYQSIGFGGLCRTQNYAERYMPSVLPARYCTCLS